MPGMWAGGGPRVAGREEMLPNRVRPGFSEAKSPGGEAEDFRGEESVEGRKAISPKWPPLSQYEMKQT